MNYSKDVGESALENPLPWDTIPSANIEKLNLVGPYLDELLKRSNERVATNQDFVYIREDIEHFKKRQADKTISLNEQQRLKEKEEADARQKARDKERLARKESDQKVYELTLRQVDLPGLPPPIEKTNTLAAKVSGTMEGAPGMSTNPASAVAKAATSTSNFDDDEEVPSPPAVDSSLDEAEHILVDYIFLLSRESVLTVNH